MKIITHFTRCQSNVTHSRLDSGLFGQQQQLQLQQKEQLGKQQQCTPKTTTRHCVHRQCQQGGGRGKELVERCRVLDRSRLGMRPWGRNQCCSPLEKEISLVNYKEQATIVFYPHSRTHLYWPFSTTVNVILRWEIFREINIVFSFYI